MVVKILISALLAMTFLATPASAATVRQITGFGSNPGALRMYEYIPDGLAPGRPVVVALHGCTQDATYGQNAGWIDLADRLRFTVVLPQQVTANNFSQCFNWFQSLDIRRGSGEAESIAQMARRGVADAGADPRRVYVTGLSAGGAMTSVILAAYPDLFAGGGVVAGLPYGCAATVIEAYTCMNPGKDLTPRQWGDKVRAASTFSGARPGVNVWHGGADYTVASANMRELSEQWTDVGAPVQTRLITGMGHGQPVAPGQGCGRAGAYMLDVGVCAAAELSRAWGL
ncbi:extracellular catalytic domain type 1 short-chain-length polyhydroxyalkanoate depolymerase [Kibdelosporangium persicum]|uniref:extracellular catalytic domain type 1 short-chain-length polyhydroxyalkanoate depolymerase n=1 Tax=Kibdelosporangium persicum TaxID=2698649 RepID=UPI0028AAEDEE|nr:PHB depolymerase family esterase [Kibdelosporangium persicum]